MTRSRRSTGFICDTKPVHCYRRTAGADFERLISSFLAPRNLENLDKSIRPATTLLTCGPGMGKSARMPARKINPAPIHAAAIPKHAGGRPSGYRAEFVPQVYKLALLGLNDDEIASVFGITAQTMYRWDAEHPEFCSSRARGKAPADAEVSARLYHRALGYSHKAVKIMQYEGDPIVVPYTEHYPPDTQAATWWLKNRQPKQWRDKTDHEITGKDGAPIAVSITERRQAIASSVGSAFTDADFAEIPAAPKLPAPGK